MGEEGRAGVHGGNIRGLLTGGAFLDGMKGMYKFPDDPSLTGHFMIAIQTEAVMSRGTASPHG